MQFSLVLDVIIITYTLPTSFTFDNNLLMSELQTNGDNPLYT